MSRRDRVRSAEVARHPKPRRHHESETVPRHLEAEEKSRLLDRDRSGSALKPRRETLNGSSLALSQDA